MDPDPVTLEVLKNEFIGIADEMAAIIRRTARSFAAREGSDFSAAVLLPDGRLVARSGVNTWYIPNTLPWIIEKFRGELKPGDVFISNDPYTGGTHLPDIIVVAPVFTGNELSAFVGTALHHTDLGGRAAGGMSPLCTELYEEGLLLPRVRLYDGGVLVASVLEILEANTRSPQDVVGDMDAQVAGCWAGIRGVTRLVNKYGAATVRDYAEHLIVYTECAVRRAISLIPDGDYYAESYLEGDNGNPNVKLALTVHKEGEHMTLDFGGTDPQTPYAINLPPSTLAGNTLQRFHQLFEIDVPANSGLLAPITIVAPEGSVVNPRFPAAVGARSAVSTKLSALLFSALSQAIPERVPAEALTSAIMLYTPDPDGSPSQVIFDLWIGSTGARPQLDGIDGPRLMQRISGELMEQEAPIVLEGHGLISDTGGPGRYRGGLATFRSWRFLRSGRLYVRNLSSTTPAYGLAGGGSGSISQVIVTSDGVSTDYSDLPVLEMPVQTGDRLFHARGGAGGHGDPFLRDPEDVLHDVREGRVTVTHALASYGVGIDPESLTLDERQTRVARGQA